ncbi:MAG: FkbM family methyltransferase, partial [Paracoccaceae bacterium]|nr:FkbM family methyltransferase [Paracoccaceae bacterium]
MYFTSEQRTAFRRVSPENISNNASISEIDGLFKAMSVERQADQGDIPAFYEDVVESEISKCDHEKICFLTYDLSVKFFTYSENRKKISKILLSAAKFDYVVEDSIVTEANTSACIIFSKVNNKEVSSVSSFIPNYGERDKLFNMSFRNSNDSIRLKSILSGDFYEPVLLRHVINNYTGGAVLDVGANIGNHSVFFAHYLQDKPDFSLDAFEPEASAHKFLKENLANNVSSPRISVHNVAVGSANGSVDLNSGSSNNLGAAKVIRSSYENTLKIPMKPLDEIVPPSKNVSIIKMDIEGFEPNALIGS